MSVVPKLIIDNVHLTSSSSSDVLDGLLGWIRCSINGELFLDGLTLRRTADGRLTISFPARRDRSGRLHPCVRPADDTVRRTIEDQVFAALGLSTEVTP